MLENENDLKEFERRIGEIYLNEGKPVYTLLECLNSANDKTIDAVFAYYKDIHNVIKGNVKSEKNKIEKLNSKIPEMFLDFLEYINPNDNQILDEY